MSRSVSILDTTRVGDWIAHAVMCVEREDGATFPASYEGNGFYRIPTGDLDPASGYRLNFTIDGKNYQSSFLKPIETAPIDSVSWQKSGLGQPISIHVSSRAGADQSTYYRWTYFETWEVITPLTATAGYLDGVFMMFDPAMPHNTRYCWGRDSSKTLLLENTAPLAENVVVRKNFLRSLVKMRSCRTCIMSRSYRRNYGRRLTIISGYCVMRWNAREVSSVWLCRRATMGTSIVFPTRRR